MNFHPANQTIDICKQNSLFLKGENKIIRIYYNSQIIHKIYLIVWIEIIFISSQTLNCWWWVTCSSSFDDIGVVSQTFLDTLHHIPRVRARYDDVVRITIFPFVLYHLEIGWMSRANPSPYWKTYLVYNAQAYGKMS